MHEGRRPAGVPYPAPTPAENSDKLHEDLLHQNANVLRLKSKHRTRAENLLDQSYPLADERDRLGLPGQALNLGMNSEKPPPDFLLLQSHFVVFFVRADTTGQLQNRTVRKRQFACGPAHRLIHQQQ
jgi:hypothetical protein